MAIKGKAKVVDEIWNEDRIRSFLTYQVNARHSQGEADFHILYRAYKYMRSGDFCVFLGFFIAQGRNLDAKDHQGYSVLDIARRNNLSTDFVRLLEDAYASKTGAQTQESATTSRTPNDSPSRS